MSRYFAEPRRVLAAGLLLIALVVVVGVLLPTGPLRVDGWWSELMADMRSSPLDRIAHWFNDLGRGVLRAVTIVAIGAVLLLRRRLAGLLAFAILEALTPLAGNLLKALADRPRPPGALLTAHASSFPSGHVAYAAATAVAVVVLLGGRHRAAWWAIAALAVAGMMWSRTYLQVHWLSDTVAGAMLGTGVALAVLAATQLAVDQFGPRPPWSSL